MGAQLEQKLVEDRSIEDQDLRLLGRLWAVLHDFGKPRSLLDGKDQTLYNLAYLDKIIPVLNEADVPSYIIEALRVVIGQDLLGRSIQYYARPDTRERPGTLPPDRAREELHKLARAFPPELRRKASYILKVCVLSDILSYTSYGPSTYVDEVAGTVTIAHGKIDYLFKQDEGLLTLNYPPVVELFDSLQAIMMY